MRLLPFQWEALLLAVALVFWSRYRPRSPMIAVAGLQQRVLPHPVAAYVGTYEHPTLGTIELREVNGRLGMFAGAAGSAVEVFDAARNRLRIQPTSTASVINLEMAHGRAVALTYSGQRFVGR